MTELPKTGADWPAVADRAALLAINAVGMALLAWAQRINGH